MSRRRGRTRMLSGGPLTALEFPPNSATPSNTVRLTLQGSNYPGIAPFSMIWRVYFFPQEDRYNTTFFNCHQETSFTNTFQYYGCHPYPTNFGVAPCVRNMEISVEGVDHITDDNGNSTLVTGVLENKWLVQAVSAVQVGNEINLTFWWDLHTSPLRVITYQTNANFFGRPAGANQGLTWGDAPWAPSDESLNGRLRAIQVFQTNLNLSQVLTLSASQYDNSALAAAAGLGLSHHYLCMNPTAANVTDRSGNGRNPVWVNANRPADYQEAA